MRAYADAFDAGHAHSFEVWNQAGALVAGGYGVGTGAAFSAESQFAHESNASRIGMTVLNWHLAQWRYRFNDGKLIGPLWQNMGFREIPRREFLTRLAEAVKAPGKTGRWQVETDLATVSHWQPAAGADRLISSSVDRNAHPTNGICAASSLSRERLCPSASVALAGVISGIGAGGTG